MNTYIYSDSFSRVNNNIPFMLLFLHTFPTIYASFLHALKSKVFKSSVMRLI